MMTSKNLLSRLLPSNAVPHSSIYEDLRGRGPVSDPYDVEDHAGMAVDEENLRAPFHEYELDNNVFDGNESQMTTESAAFLTQKGQRQSRRTSAERQKKKESLGANWLSRSPRLLEDDGDDDVPASLLIEDEDEPGPSEPPRQQAEQRHARKAHRPVPGPSTRDTRARWEAAQPHQRLHQDDLPTRPHIPKPGIITGNPREKALWTWVNVTNLDHFMAEVYDYYNGSGIWCMLTGRLLNLCTVVFVTSFTTFLTQCVDYKKIPHSLTLKDALIPQCTKKMSGTANFAIWLLSIYIIYKLFMDLVDFRRLKRMHDFYLHLLNIPDSDIQTISWQEIVARLMALRDQNPLTAEKLSPALQRYLRTQSKQRMDAHDIANRLMRKENYLIALFNKDILDLTLPIPFLGRHQIFSRTIEWNLHYCILDFIFNSDGQVNQLVLKDTRRRELSDALRSRFLFAGFMNVVCAPVIVMYLLITYFFKYFNEYQKNPASLGSRQYTPLAEWKFREFNELPHLFNNRVNMSYPFAERYVQQFPKVKTVQISRFIAFVAGALVSVLGVSALIDPELFLGFEITKDRTVLFYLGVIGTIWAVAHGVVPPENLVFDPEYALRNVIDYTHYMPNHWKDQLHSDDVRRDFSVLYKMKVVIFLEEVVSIILTPFVLWFCLPQCSERIIDFFREFTIHVDGLGYVCSFAVFDFKKGMNLAPQGASNAADGLRDEYYSTKHGKMAASYYGFLDNYVTNPKTGIPGHVPPGMKPHFPPPSFPGLQSPTHIATDLQASRMSREHLRTRAGAGAVLGRSSRFMPIASHASPMPSMLLDPHHQPSASGFGAGRSTHGAVGRSRYQTSRDIIEYPEDEEDVNAEESPQRGDGLSQGNIGGLGESRWETSPTRTMYKAADDEDDAAGGNAGGVLGLLYQFQKAQTDGRGPGVNI